ncbi:hypothetical protein Y919_08405 [Caloranaerobacter azorensis H53214]|uniref:Glycosyl transferase family 1 n=2 Tax=Caloranaerobacter azorensis TaxID=116090 RepID=A0A096DLC9_9FIRM|nr:hypothetical protein [Caloranaerobacter azorensis]KGG80056.1 hypothetical protein Y919_08405 [Caloranaerobacter azorensis H53214]
MDSTINNTKIDINIIKHQMPEITIVFPPLLDWYLLYQRPQQLATAFSKIYNVRCIYISNEVYKKLNRPILKVNDNLFVVRINTDYSQLVKGKKILWFSYPKHYKYITEGFDFVVFDGIDVPADEFLFWTVDLKRAIDCANIIACTSELLYKLYRKYNKPIFMCTNAADYEHFKIAQEKLPKPSDFPTIKSNEKVIGYYGALASWLDYKLISKISDRYKVILIGKNKYYKKVIEHPNLTILEHKDYSQLPYYLSHFDLAMIPFKLTRMINGCDPIKYYEFISAGKPVVSTEIYEIKRKYSEITYFMNYNNCYQIIERAIKEDCLSKKLERIEIAKENTWDIRAKKAYDEIIKYLFLD